MFVHNYETAKMRNYHDFVAIHRSPHHVDDIMAAAIAMHYTPGTEYQVVVIGRSKEEIEFCKKNAYMILDVGMMTGESTNMYGYKQYRFDHHQYFEDDHPKYENGIKKAATGLLLEHYYKQGKFERGVYEYLLDNLIYGIDSNDNGQTTEYRNKLMFVSDFSKMKFETESEYLENLEEMIEFAEKIFNRNLELGEHSVGEKLYVTDVIKESTDKGYIFLDSHCDCAAELIRKYNELNPENKIYFILEYNTDEDEYVINTVKINPTEFAAFKQLPEEWAGKSGEELANVSGFKSAIFCHRGRFIAKFKDKGDAINAVEYCVK